MIDQLVRKHLTSLKPYQSARNEFSGKANIFLDANESPYGQLNRYPDPLQNNLKELLATWKQCRQEQLFIGNGSDEILDLLIRVFCEPGEDKIMIFPPTYGMYEVLAKINNNETVSVELNNEFQLNKQKVKQLIAQEPKLKLCFVCSPNNPTGNLIEDVQWLSAIFPGVVVVDEAYIQYSNNSGNQELFNRYRNVVITQTFSKALSSAAIRVGYALADKNIIQWLTKIKPPYNVSALNQQVAIKQLADLENIKRNINSVIHHKNQLEKELKEVPFVRKVFPSEANFLLVKVDDALQRYNELRAEGIIVRNRHKLVTNCLRITVGTKLENNRLIHVMKQL